MERSGAGSLHGFPAALSSFVGRAEAVNDVAGLLDQYRLVTVTGPGGAGKTRLADQVAQLVAGRFGDGTWLAELVSGDRLAPVRHRSLEAAADWSYQLLDEPDQRVFRRLSAFPGPFTLEGAEAVAGPDAGSAVFRLVDCSLLVPPRTGPDGRHRYMMLETLRAYGARLLAGAGETDAAVAALARYALQVAEEAAEGLDTITREGASVCRLDAEDATLRQGLAWAAEHDPAMMPRLTAAIGGDRDEAVRFARQAQQVEADLPGAIARVFSHTLTGVLIMGGDLAAAERACVTGLARSHEVGDLWNVGSLLHDLVVIDLRTGRVDDAAEHLRELLQSGLRSGFDAELFLGLDCCGYLCAATGRYAEAVTVWTAFTALRENGLADVRALLHQRAHGQLPPGPDPRQDGLPPPRRPDPPRPQRGPGLAATRVAGDVAADVTDAETGVGPNVQASALADTEA